MTGRVGDYKGDVASSEKRFGFCFPPHTTGSRHPAVFGSAIDVLSPATLQQRDGWPWTGWRLALGGTSPSALLSFLHRHPEVSRVVLHLDNDRAGLTAARRMRDLLRRDFRRLRVSINPPRKAKDYNELVQERLKIDRLPQPERSASR